MLHIYKSHVDISPIKCGCAQACLETSNYYFLLFYYVNNFSLKRLVGVLGDFRSLFPPCFHFTDLINWFPEKNEAKMLWYYVIFVTYSLLSQSRRPAFSREFVCPFICYGIGRALYMVCFILCMEVFQECPSFICLIRLKIFLASPTPPQKNCCRVVVTFPH